MRPGSSRAGRAGDSEAAAAVIKQLADLGYIDAVPEDRQEAIDQTIREQRWNLARALVDGGRLEEAAAMLTDLWDRWPDEGRLGMALIRHAARPRPARRRPRHPRAARQPQAGRDAVRRR